MNKVLITVLILAICSVAQSGRIKREAATLKEAFKKDMNAVVMSAVMELIKLRLDANSTVYEGRDSLIEAFKPIIANLEKIEPITETGKFLIKSTLDYLTHFSNYSKTEKGNLIFSTIAYVINAFNTYQNLDYKEKYGSLADELMEDNHVTSEASHIHMVDNVLGQMAGRTTTTPVPLLSNDLLLDLSDTTSKPISVISVPGAISSSSSNPLSSSTIQEIQLPSTTVKPITQVSVSNPGGINNNAVDPGLVKDQSANIFFDAGSGQPVSKIPGQVPNINGRVQFDTKSEPQLPRHRGNIKQQDDPFIKPIADLP